MIHTGYTGDRKRRDIKEFIHVFIIVRTESTKKRGWYRDTAPDNDKYLIL